MKAERTFPQSLAVILIHEVGPRAKKHGFRPPAQFSAALAVLEHEGEHTRRQTRQLLDRFYEATVASKTQEPLDTNHIL